MKLYQFLHENKIGVNEFAEIIGCSDPTISTVKFSKTSPNLLIAMKIHEATGGQVSFEDLLKEDDAVLLGIWREDQLESKK